MSTTDLYAPNAPIFDPTITTLFTPLFIETLFHISYRNGSLIEREGYPAQARALRVMMDQRLIQSSAGSVCGYALLPRGEAYLHALKCVPLPVQRAVWTLPPRSEAPNQRDLERA